ncbi:hypothetical protein EXN22_17780 [Pseudomonas tructae]|uniref:Phage tail protein C-terminal domain-containing protein n=1 Tax=Pseudomonas tructae TaxID=2518644 RepID=A0A411MQP1_9PSED|nr:hypothetical protein EXN22_17780 [Pseudomonas tructae]
MGTAGGNLLEVGALGVGGASVVDGNANSARQSGFYGFNSNVNTPVTAFNMLSSDWGVDNRWQTQFGIAVSSNRAFFRSIMKDQSVASAWAELYHTGNTTRGSGGALSAASPIVRIANVSDSERRDLQEQTFQGAGAWGVANDEARGVQVERLALGEYRIAGSLGLAVEGWRTQDPCSPDGGRPLGITESEQSDDGAVTVRLFKQRWTLTDDGELLLSKGVPLDVPLNSWIDVRLDMPPPTPPAIPRTEP